MSVTGEAKLLTVPEVVRRKGGEPLVCLTAYTTPLAKALDPHCDIILVGDSLGMVLHGLPSTVGVTVDMMILHGKAARRGMRRALLVVDLPFGSYEAGPVAAFETASRVMKETDCAAVKLEGGTEMAETIRFLVARGIPVMAHIGLTPQAVHATGGYKVQGRGEAAARVLADAQAVTEAGAFSIVLEKIPESLARTITEQVSIPTIGIGASAACDGQVLVTEDMLGLFTDFQPKFVKRYAELGRDTDAAAEAYAREVRARTFPGEAHVFGDAPKRGGASS